MTNRREDGFVLIGFGLLTGAYFLWADGTSPAAVVLGFAPPTFTVRWLTIAVCLIVTLVGLRLVVKR